MADHDDDNGSRSPSSTRDKSNGSAPDHVAPVADADSENEDSARAASPRTAERAHDVHDAHGRVTPVVPTAAAAVPSSTSHSQARPAHGSVTHGHAAAAHGGGHDHGLAHTTPVSLLLGVLGTLMVLTVITVAVTGVDLGAQGNLVVAMVIATIKAALVVMFFMHLVWDKKLHLILFLTSVLFLILFMSMSITDRGEYQPDIDTFQSSQPAS